MLLQRSRDSHPSQINHPFPPCSLAPRPATWPYLRLKILLLILAGSDTAHFFIFDTCVLLARLRFDLVLLGVHAAILSNLPTYALFSAPSVGTRSD